MTSQEQDLLNGLIGRVNGTQLQTKDAEAERYLQGALGSNPDALYILCQTVLVQQLALNNAQAQLQTLQQRAQEAPKQEHGSFLGNLFGLGKAAPPPVPYGNASGYGAQPGYGSGNRNQPGYAPVSAPAVPTGYNYPPPQQQPGYGYTPANPGGYAPGGGGMFGGGGGFLQGAMQTAAGVVAGEFAFNAIENIFRGFGGGGHERGLGDLGSGSNNFGDYGNAPADGGLADRLGQADGLSGISPDIEDRRGEGSGFFGGSNGNDFSASDDSGSDFNSNGDDTGSDFNSNGDDTGSDGGSNDDNSF